MTVAEVAPPKPAVMAAEPPAKRGGRGGAGAEPMPVREADVTSYGPEPKDVRSWLGRLAHGRGDAWIRFVDGHELRFAIGNGPHVRFLEPTDTLPEGGIRFPLA